MKILIEETEYISESELAENQGITKEAIRQRRKRGYYKKNDIVVLKERVFYKNK